jgi:hypothetical protein
MSEELKRLERRERDLQNEVYKLRGQRTPEAKRALKDLTEVQAQITELKKQSGK